VSTENITTTRPINVTLEKCVNNEIIEIASIDGRRIAMQDGIYDAQTGQKLSNYGLGEHELRNCASLNVFYPCA